MYHACHFSTVHPAMLMYSAKHEGQIECKVTYWGCIGLLFGGSGFCTAKWPAVLQRTVIGRTLK